jgi:flavodoxin
MKSLVIYDSYFGNIEKVAKAIAADPILKKLKRRGGEVVLESVGFYVKDITKRGRDREG